MGAKRTAISVGALVAALTIAGCAAESTPPAAHTTPTAAPSPVPTLSARERTHAWVDRRLAGMTLEQKAASLLMVHAPGTDPAPLRALVDQGVGGVILMGDNIPGTPEELRDLTSALHVESDARPWSASTRRAASSSGCRGIPQPIRLSCARRRQRTRRRPSRCGRTCWRHPESTSTSGSSRT